MKFKDAWHLAWIYNRMIKAHGEKPTFDYMTKFRQVIVANLALLDVPVGLTEDADGLLSLQLQGEQP